MIERYSFGQIVIQGEMYTSDLLIVRGQVIPGWWRVSGHRVEPEDLTQVLAAEPEILVLGKGSPGMMKASDSLRSVLKEQNIELIEQDTAKAAKTFNRMLQKGKNVAAGFHLTC